MGNNTDLAKTIFSVTLAGTVAIGTGWGEAAKAIGQQLAPATAHDGTLLSLEFKPPGDAIPTNTVGGGTRGTINFRPPGDATPNNTSSGGTRGVSFRPPGDATPNNTSSGGTRGVSFRPPGDAAPSNTASGGSRNPDIPAMTPVLPQNRYGRTVSARPTFYVFVPPTTSREVFFSIQDENRNHHYQTTLSIKSGGGLVGVTLPDDAPELEMGKNYQWFFVLLPPGGTLRPDSYGVQGWVKRVEAPTLGVGNLEPLQIATLYASNGIWYDTVERLVAAKTSQPSDATIVNEWQDLLGQVGLEAIAPWQINEQL
ncbi:MAG TPA: DUF928 domain-containing protein [Oscillatoriaceae cyanobacterium M33_DOE_052]|uniref:DUF928 domain-containing protein n=1 Tax=Planktothricoides sp. SpSt-374 TaxID=2282167 RepID=A0A7C3VEN6_9CYAN|nr:DUF928 domain-containing protein [Oscillatoriaceae cyanobacterium M33_DOE_052]